MQSSALFLSVTKYYLGVKFACGKFAHMTEVVCFQIFDFKTSKSNSEVSKVIGGQLLLSRKLRLNAKKSVVILPCFLNNTWNMLRFFLLCFKWVSHDNGITLQENRKKQKQMFKTIWGEPHIHQHKTLSVLTATFFNKLFPSVKPSPQCDIS